ncbi:glutathione peroxidase [Salinibacillus kushneri]|uniref:Glutathione peroxidase n=1 Tax=Salinibacillus kushneri TaxID=237682 RepID=A0A1I0IAN5_9BACI|nr:glutathione peroxidase [Salinibacillus kushneri]SET93720.1 glutathione peroxidase [Salinibacillus kushneri]
MPNSIYDFTALLSNGDKVFLENYQGKVLLIVNTASKCGFTPQFKGLQNLYDSYKDDDFAILGFPCAQFANQEFEQQDEIIHYCQSNYGVDFPMFQKIDVKGEHAHPLFQYLTSAKKGILTEDIKWNFTKFLINRNGEVVKRYAPSTKPEKIAGDIEKELVKSC